VNLQGIFQSTKNLSIGKFRTCTEHIRETDFNSVVATT
jgi:hypothetical protein